MVTRCNVVVAVTAGGAAVALAALAVTAAAAAALYDSMGRLPSAPMGPVCAGGLVELACGRNPTAGAPGDDRRPNADCSRSGEARHASLEPVRVAPPPPPTIPGAPSPTANALL